MLTRMDCMVYIIAAALLLLHFKLAKYNNKAAVLHTLLIMPFLYFSVSMLTEAVIIDEPQYIFSFINPEEIKNQGNFSMKALYEYRLSQLIIGTLFALIPGKVRAAAALTELGILYKVIHFFWMYLTALAIARIWRKQIFKNNDGMRVRLSEDALLIALIGLPLSCLFLKVCNYDSGSTYPALLGFSMLWGAYRDKSIKEGAAATLITASGVLEKWTALPYWCICVVLFAHLVIETRENKKYFYGLLAVMGSYGFAILFSFFYLIYARFYQGGLCAPVNIGNITFSFTHAARAAIVGDMGVDYNDPAAYNADAVLYVFLVIFAMAGCLAVMEAVLFFIKKNGINVSNLFHKICAGIIPIFIIGGIISAYFIPLKIAPYLEIQPGYYPSADSFDGSVYHYGAKTAIGHFLCKIGYMCGTIICSYPTIVTVLAIVTAVYVLKNKVSDSPTNLFAGLFWICSILLMGIYAVMGMPSDARYFSFSIYAFVFVILYYANQFYILNKTSNGLMMAGMVCFAAEMVMYAPNFKNFSPIWVEHSREHNETIRVGEWYIGENMFWGEELAIGGNRIKNRVDKETPGQDYSQINIYTNYGTVWLYNWGKEEPFHIQSLYSDEKVMFDENSYFILSKFRLYREDVPAFIYEVKPMDTIQFKGDIGAWIYRGDQLKQYEDYFLSVKGD